MYSYNSILLIFKWALISRNIQMAQGSLLSALCWPKVKVKSLSRVQLFATLWTVAYQAPLSLGFSRQEYWSGLPFPSPGDLPDLGIEPGFPALQADALTAEPPGKPRILCNGGVICISELIDISPGKLHSSLCFLQPRVFHDSLCI